MADPSKWEKTLSKLNAPGKSSPTPQILLPEKAPPPRGKRSSAGWKQKAVLLKEASIDEALQRLKRRGDRTDFSDLMQALLEAWLETAE
jgi:hypothetical protein